MHLRRSHGSSSGFPVQEVNLYTILDTSRQVYLTVGPRAGVGVAAASAARTGAGAKVGVA